MCHFLPNGLPTRTGMGEDGNHPLPGEDMVTLSQCHGVSTYIGFYSCLNRKTRPELDNLLCKAVDQMLYVVAYLAYMYVIYH